MILCFFTNIFNTATFKDVEGQNEPDFALKATNTSLKQCKYSFNTSVIYHCKIFKHAEGSPLSNTNLIKILFHNLIKIDPSST